MPTWQMKMLQSINAALNASPTTAAALARELIVAGDSRCFSTVYTQVRHILHALYAVGLIDCTWSETAKIWSTRRSYSELDVAVNGALHGAT